MSLFRHSIDNDRARKQDSVIKEEAEEYLPSRLSNKY
jgi:hypothetical protein